MAKKKTPSNITDVINITRNMGNELNAQYTKSKDLKVAQLSLKAYSTAINAAKTQVVYKKLTGRPTRITFLEN